MYRIKIEEKYNGEILYIPQVCELKITGKWIKRQELVWYNIIGDGELTMALSETSTAKYKTEEYALKIIENHKNVDVIREGNKIKSTTYKIID